jgi:predicted Zn finger-like uncharacterized protein
MIIECEKCHVKYNLDENLLKETGSKVRCSRCKHVFTAFPPERELQIEEAPAEGLEETEESVAEEIFKQEDLLSDLEKAFAEEVEEGVGEEEMEIGGEVEEIEEEEEEIEAISFDELSQLDSGPIKRAEEEVPDIDEAMDRAAKVEQEITAQEEVEREEEVEEVEEPVEPRPIVKKRRRSRLSITILLIVLIIAGGGYALVRFKPDFLPESFPLFKRPLSKDQAFDMGNKRLSFKELNGSFVNSKKAGKLFVVKGLVTNMYPDKRSFIRIRSNILDSKGKAVKSKIIYAGNPISDKELLSLSMEEVDNRLRDKFGKNKMNTNIPPNSSIPLMIVFGNLPQDMSEFEVEPISSSPAEK